MNRVPSEYGGSFYRDKLTEQGKYFYDCIVSHFVRGNFSSAVHVKIYKCGTAFPDGFAAYKAVRDDKPELFFLGNQCEFVQRGSKGTIKCTILYSESEIRRIQLQLRKMICRLVRNTAYKPVIEQERMVYERIAKKLTYTNNNDMRDHNVVGPLLLSSGVCEGYNALLMLCFRRLEIPCIKVYGKSERNVWHCWCIAWINGVPVHCDVTWDKPVDGIVFYDYFNLSDRQIATDHFSFLDPNIPKCNAEYLNFYHYARCSFKTRNEMAKYIYRRLINGDSRPIYIQATFASGYDDILQNVRQALKNGRNDSKRYIYVNKDLKTAVITKQ